MTTEKSVIPHEVQLKLNSCLRKWDDVRSNQMRRFYEMTMLKIMKSYSKILNYVMTENQLSHVVDLKLTFC